MSDFERRVVFQPGYNYLHEKGPGARGQHGMSICFVLIGSEGATQFKFGTSWTPLGIVDENAPHHEPCHIDRAGLRSYDFGFGGQYGMVNAPTGYDLGHHWSVPTYESEMSFECEYVSGGRCFYDGSGLRADDLLRRFISEGEDAVWAALEAEYESIRAEVAA